MVRTSAPVSFRSPTRHVRGEGRRRRRRFPRPRRSWRRCPNLRGRVVLRVHGHGAIAVHQFVLMLHCPRRVARPSRQPRGTALVENRCSLSECRRAPSAARLRGVVQKGGTRTAGIVLLYRSKALKKSPMQELRLNKFELLPAIMLFGAQTKSRATGDPVWALASFRLAYREFR